MKFNWCTLKVNNMEESLKFYQEIVGLPLNTRHQAGSGFEMAFLGEGETKLELICQESNDESNVGKDISLGFEVKSLDEMIAFIQEKGYEIYEGPLQPSPHVRFFFLLDPNGLKIQFVEHM